MEKELTAAGVRKLPEMSKVTIHGTDKYGYPYRSEVFVHETAAGKKVLMSLKPYGSGFIEIRNRKGQRYTVEVNDDDQRVEPSVDHPAEHGSGIHGGGAGERGRRP